ncbi:MAG: hypothetical protein ACLUDF_04825 [Butyricicoccus sp.]
MKKNCFARFAAAALSLAMLAGCGASQSSDSAAEDTGSADSAELTVFAAASMTETLNRIAEDYKVVDLNVTLTFNLPPATCSPRSRRARTATHSSPQRPSR